MAKFDFPEVVKTEAWASNLQKVQVMALPFPVAYIWALYGEVKAKPEEGPIYYGGWAANLERVKAIADACKLTPEYPDGWLIAERSMQNGDVIQALLTRAVYICPVGYREIWRSETGGASLDYQDGYRHHLQVLALVANVSPQKDAKAWSMAVLTAKGYQASWVLQAIKNWSYMMGEARAVVAPNVPEWAFYIPLGTFGQERKLQTVGGDHPQKLTTITTFTPAELATRIKLIERLYIGYEGVEVIAGIANDPRVQAWLRAWDNPVNDPGPGIE